MNRLMGVLLIALAFTAARPALAQEDPKAVARAKLVEGSDLLKRGEYREALIRFQEAYALVPSPKILYNFGLAYIGLSRNAEAIDAFERFLAEATDAAPDLRANAEKHRQTLSLQIGTVIIECDTEGAEISIDGRSRGITPARGPIRLDPGPHALLVEKAGVPPYSRKMQVDAGQKIIVEVHMIKTSAPAPAPVIVMAAPASAPLAPPPEKPPRSWKFKTGLALGVVAVAALGFGIVERLSANSKFSDFNGRPDAAGNKMCDADDRVPNHGGPDCDSLLSDGRSAASKATVGLIAGAVLAAGSVALLAVSWNERVPPASQVSSASGGASAGLACSPTLLQPGLACALRF
jgi:PEGA domain